MTLKDGGRHALLQIAVAVPKVSISVDRDFARLTPLIAERVAADPCLERVRSLPVSEFEALLYCILRHFSRWCEHDEEQMEACTTLIENVCFVRSVPRFEAASLVYAIRDSVLDIFRLERLRSGASGVGPLDEDAGRFFDLLVFELLRGY